MEEVELRLRLQITLRQGPWVAVVLGGAGRVRRILEGLAAEAGDVQVQVTERFPDPLLDPERQTGRWIVVLPEGAEVPIPSPWLACAVSVSVSGGEPEPLALQPLLSCLGSDALQALIEGIDILLDRGWYADAGAFVERARFLAYRAASTTWEDRQAMRWVAEAEERSARLAGGLGEGGQAWEAWRTAWWVWSELASTPDDQERMERAARQVEAWSAHRTDA